jgi:putative nucleotidyltransferase-like protein
MSMSSELTLIVHQIARGAGMRGPARSVPSSVDWDRWLHLVDENQLGPFLASRCPAIEVPRSIALELRDRYTRSGHEAAFRHVELMRIASALDGIAEPIVLKGAALAYTLYAEASERPMSDIDLLFASAKDVGAATPVLAKLGYSPRRKGASATPEGHRHAEPLINGVAEMTLELHTNLATPPLPRRVLAWMWRRRVRLEGAGRNAWALDASSALMHHAIHALADPVDSPLLRNLFEVAWLASELNAVDRSAVRSLAVRWGIEPLLSPALSLGARLFGSPEIVKPPPRGARDLLCRARLEWGDSFDEAPKKRSEMKRSLARAHFSVLKRRARPKKYDWDAFMAAAVRLFVGIVFGKMRAALRVFGDLTPKRGRPIEPVTLSTVDFGERMLAHDARTGCVHLLDAASARVFAAMKGARSPKQLEALLRANGLEARETRRALDRLKRKGLVRPRRIQKGATPWPKPSATA